jgi:hypothetical protein
MSAQGAAANECLVALESRCPPMYVHILLRTLRTSSDEHFRPDVGGLVCAKTGAVIGPLVALPADGRLRSVVGGHVTAHTGRLPALST